MDVELAWRIGAVTAGAAGGLGAAWLSVKLPAEVDIRPTLSMHRLALMGAGGVLAGAWAGWAMSGPSAVITALLGVWLLLIATIDGEHFWLPNLLTVPLGLTGLAVAAAGGPTQLLDAMIGAVAGFAALTVISALYRRLRGREGLGGGDARLLAAAGAWVGWIGLPSVLVWGSVAGLSWVAARVVGRRAPQMTDPLPYGTFLALGVWLTWLLGPLGR